MKIRSEVKKAILIGALCAITYFSVYLCRDILSTLGPELQDGGIFSKSRLGTMSSVFFFTYAVGQLINGIIGDRIKSKYMVSMGLILAAVCFFFIQFVTVSPMMPYILYGGVGFFLAMVYAPMTKMIAENTEPMLATRCNVAHSLASYLGAPAAGLLAMWMTWRPALSASCGVMLAMGMLFFLSVTIFEKKGMVRYGQYQPTKEPGGSVTVLLHYQILRWMVIAMLTGIVRTAVLFWLPTYIPEYLHCSEEQSAVMYSVATSVIAINSFLAVFIFVRLRRNLEWSILLFFSVAAVCFLGTYFIRQPIVNISLMTLAMIFSNCASSIMWSRYCPSLRDTGMVSSATGFLDFCSYMAAAISSKLFAGAVSVIGWQNLILIWVSLMVCGMATGIPTKRKGAVQEI